MKKATALTAILILALVLSAYIFVDNPAEQSDAYPPPVTSTPNRGGR